MQGIIWSILNNPQLFDITDDFDVFSVHGLQGDALNNTVSLQIWLRFFDGTQTNIAPNRGVVSPPPG
jgi:hypothetical protein